LQISLVKYQVPGIGDVKSYRYGVNSDGGKRADNAEVALTWLLEEYIIPVAEKKVTSTVYTMTIVYNIYAI
jgi:hypothetical protein